jgi:colanic acid/amylovoran biosynthesis glycosyltransferase
MASASHVTPVRNRRVAHVVRCYGETSQTFVADTVREIDEQGWEGWIATREVKNRNWFPYPSDERILLGKRPSLRRRLANRASLRPAFERRAAWLQPSVAAVDPALIHAHFGWMGVDAVPVARTLRLPLVVSFHGTDLTVFPHTKRGRGEYPELFATANRVTVVSQFLKRKLHALGFHVPVDIIPMGVPVAEIPFRGATPESNPTRLLFVGRQVERKGLHVLLSALAQVRARNGEVVLGVIGDGPMADANRELVERLGLTSAVEFHGAEPRERVLEELRRAHVFVMPSLTPPDGEAEGSPTVTKEAMAVGVPIVATDNGGTVETIPPPYKHEIVPEGDSDALAASILSLLRRRDEWAERARVGREWVETQFDNRVLASRMVAIYEELADGAEWRGTCDRSEARRVSKDPEPSAPATAR